MPIYEYQCRACGHRSEEFQKMSDPPLTTCGSCGGELKKLISAPAVQFKGSGWYVTDYAKSGAKPDAGRAAEAKADGGADSSSAKNESKSDAKTSGSSSGSETGSGGSSGDAKPAAKPATAGSSD